MNEILKSSQQVQESIEWLESNGFVYPKECLPKAWDQAQIIPHLTHGDILEMGCYSSVAIENAIKLHLKGRKIGIDLRKRDPNFKGEYISGDLLNPPFEDWSFDTIICLSVIEHGIDLDKFFEVCSRKLRLNGQLLLTFDYWNPKVNNHGTDTQPFCKDDVVRMIVAAKRNSLHTPKMNFDQGEPVITWGNHSPHKELKYTFGSMRLVKA